jgi:ABC-type multidrug transport system fused ATPase/permease subunit
VEFDHVFFSNARAEAATRVEALADVSFRAEEGTVTAQVGPSGSDKSTAASLIPVSGTWPGAPPHRRLRRAATCGPKT